LGCINVHASLLPRWRGAAPIHRALLAGDTETGITIMQMDAGLDTGAMLSKATCAIDDNDTSGTLHDRLAVLGAELLVSTLAPLAAGTLAPEPQDDQLANYAHKLDKQEGLIDWTLPAAEILRRIRGFNPWPVCFTRLGDDNLRIWSAEPDQQGSDAAAGTILAADGQGIHVACGQGTLRLTQLQLPGGKAQPVKTLLNAHKERFAPGVKLG